jgi:phospholipid transport system substrate-binding protein
LAQVSDQTVRIKPMRAAADDKDVLVRTEIVGRGPHPARLPPGKTPGEGAGWKIYNLNVLGVWLVETYRSQFAQEINAKGIDGLIDTLVPATSRTPPKADRWRATSLHSTSHDDLCSRRTALPSS